MFINLSPGAVKITGLELPELVLLAQKHGFGGIDLPIAEVAAMEKPDRASEVLASADLHWGGFGLPVNFREDEDAYLRGMDLLREYAPLAQEVGCCRCTTHIMPRHNELDYQENFRLHVDRLKPAAAILAENEVRFGIEFVAPKTLRDGFKYEFVHTLDQALELAAAIGPNVGILLDSWHWYTSGSTYDELIEKLDNDKVVYVHVNDAPPGRDLDEHIDNERALPAETGVIDGAAFTRALKHIKYDGPVAAEPFIEEFAEMPPDEVAAKVAASIRTLMARAEA